MGDSPGSRTRISNIQQGISNDQGKQLLTQKQVWGAANELGCNHKYLDIGYSLLVVGY